MIVDAACERANKIAMALKHATPSGAAILWRVRERLLRLADHPGDDGAADALPKQPLAVHALRGGMYRSEAWARDPLQPAVIAATVDQLGSRLLFRAYGRGPGMWPVYAGLAANDSLIFLDEAHCAQPFLQTLHAIRRYRGWAEQPLGKPCIPVVLSATPPGGVEDRFDDRSDQRCDPIHPLGRRQRAAKPARLEVASKANEALAQRLVKAALSLVSDQRRAIVIFANRVAVVRCAYALLGQNEPEIDCAKLTGRMRPLDRDAVLAQLKRLSCEAAEHRRLDKPYIVVATQTLEVGADLDFDGLVTECASLDALRQRFGRLNRAGRSIDAEAVIVIRADQQKNTDNDPVYGGALARTWQWLQAQAADGRVDFGILAMEACLPDASTLAKLCAPAPLAPLLLPAHLDALAQTWPRPTPEPQISLFLHGRREAAADVQVVFRADIDPDDLQANIERLTLCPPSSAESLTVPIGSFQRWFNQTAFDDDASDVEGVASSPDHAGPSGESPDGWALRWQGVREAVEVKAADEIRPGDVIVLPVQPCFGQLLEPMQDAGEACGGKQPKTRHAWEALGDFPKAALPPARYLDIGDQAYRCARAKNLLRLHPKLIEAWPPGPGRQQALALCEALKERDDLALDVIVEAVRGVLNALSESDDDTESPMAWLWQTAQGLRDELPGRRLSAALHRIGDHELIIVGARLEKDLIAAADTFSDEDDAIASGVARADGRPVLLKHHLPGVERFARRFARDAGLPATLIDAVALAGRLHDLGKADQRFQRLLGGGSGILTGELLAKSARMPKLPAIEADGYPPGARHELLSVRLAESQPERLPQDPLLRDLVLHLVASHHGRCRPFAPVVFDDAEDTVAVTLDGQRYSATLPTGLARLDSGVAQRFWRLVRAYGWWGLAWLEALLRLADHRRSEWEQTYDDR